MLKKLTTSEKKLLLSKNYIGNLGYIDANQPYIIPITYFFDEPKNRIICYSNGGHKIDALRKDNSISLNVTDIDSVNKWRSVLVLGTYNEIEGSDAKSLLHEFSLGVKRVIFENELRDLDYIHEFSSKIYDGEIPIVFTIEIDELTGKSRNFKG